jgi:ribosomal protein S5
MSEALKQNATNGNRRVVGVIKVKDQKAYDAAQKALQKAQVNSIQVRIRQP